MSGFVLGTLVALMLGATGLLAAAILRIDSLSNVLLAAYIVAFGEVVTLVLVLSPFDAVTRTNLVTGSVALLVAVAALWVLTGLPRVALLPPVRQLPRLRADAVGVLGTAVALGLAYIVALILGTAPNGWDPLNYHLSRAAFWLQSGHVGYIDPTYDQRLNLNPPNGEIGFAFVLAVTHDESLAGFVQFFAALACAVGVYALARRVGLTRAEAVFGSLLFLSLPIVLLQASLAKNDLVLASFLLAAAVFTVRGRRRDIALAALATALAVGTKATALYGVVLLLALALAPRERARAARAIGISAGVVVGSYWYVVNAAETGNLFGDQSAQESVTAIFRGAANVVSAYGMLVDSFDVSGARGRDILLYGAAALALAAWMLVLRKGWRGALVAGGLVATPFLLLLVGKQVGRPSLVRLDDLLGEPAGYLGAGSVTSPTVASDTASWFGPLGFLFVVGAIAAAAVLATRRSLTPLVAVLAVAPPTAFVLAALTLSYNPWLGRFFIFPVGLSAALWGRSLRSPAAWAAAVLGTLTVVLVLVHYVEKPSGVRLLDRAPAASIWTMPRWEVQSQHDPPLAPLLQFLDERLPADASVALALGDNDFGYPAFGPNLERRITVVSSGSAARDINAEWLVASPERATEIDAECWERAFESSEGSVFRRSAGCT